MSDEQSIRDDITEGLRQSAAGEVVDLGSFEKYADGQSIQEDIARVIEENAVVPESDARQVAAALSPLLNRVRAEALREARDNVRASSFWADGSDNYADRVRGYLSNAADRIEQNSEGNET